MPEHEAGGSLQCKRNFVNIVTPIRLTRVMQTFVSHTDCIKQRTREYLRFVVSNVKESLEQAGSEHLQIVESG